jgi:hypothetical protein
LNPTWVVAETEPGRRHREKGVVGGDPQIAARGQRSAGSHARSDDNGDGRPRDGLDQLAAVLDQIVVSARIGGATARNLEIGNVRARRECLVAVAADHHRTHIVTRAHLRREGVDRAPHGSGDGIAPGWIAQL